MKRFLAFSFFALVLFGQAALADYVQLVARAKPAVVLIKVETDENTFIGTGFFVSSDGYLVTNAHVLAGAVHRLGARSVEAETATAAATTALVRRLPKLARQRSTGTAYPGRTKRQLK